MSKPSEIWREVKPKIGEMLREINDMESRCEKAQEEAYQRGYETAKHECGDCPKQAYTDTLRMDVYQKGLSDAWEAARKIADMPYGEEEKAFGSGGWTFIVKHTASEAIEKLKAYEQVQEEIKVGDEVISPYGKGVVTEITDIYTRIMYAKGSGQVVESEDLTKTGRHFPEIAEVLEKMREVDNG